MYICTLESKGFSKGRTINDLEGGGSGREFVLSFFSPANRLLSFFFPAQPAVEFQVVELSFFFPTRVAVEFFFRFCPSPPPNH